jgi:hypothetical protein
MYYGSWGIKKPLQMLLVHLLLDCVFEITGKMRVCIMLGKYAYHKTKQKKIFSDFFLNCPQQWKRA